MFLPSTWALSCGHPSACSSSLCPVGFSSITLSPRTILDLPGAISLLILLDVFKKSQPPHDLNYSQLGDRTPNSISTPHYCPHNIYLHTSRTFEPKYSIGFSGSIYLKHRKLISSLLWNTVNNFIIPSLSNIINFEVFLIQINPNHSILAMPS